MSPLKEVFLEIVIDRSCYRNLFVQNSQLINCKILKFLVFKQNTEIYTYIFRINIQCEDINFIVEKNQIETTREVTE